MLSPVKKKSLIVATLVFLALWLWRDYGPGLPQDVTVGDIAVTDLYVQEQSGVLVEIEAKVLRLLSDDKEGSPHQRFILGLSTGHTLLVAHNLELAERVPLKIGDRVRVRGEYEFNAQGGVVHFTHRDPGFSGRHGWIELAGIRYD